MRQTTNQKELHFFIQKTVQFCLTYFQVSLPLHVLKSVVMLPCRFDDGRSVAVLLNEQFRNVSHVLGCFQVIDSSFLLCFFLNSFVRNHPQEQATATCLLLGTIGVVYSFLHAVYAYGERYKLPAVDDDREV